jgi:hypothetical protein
MLEATAVELRPGSLVSSLELRLAGTVLSKRPHRKFISRKALERRFDSHRLRDPSRARPIVESPQRNMRQRRGELEKGSESASVLALT